MLNNFQYLAHVAEIFNQSLQLISFYNLQNQKDMNSAKQGE